MAVRMKYYRPSEGDSLEAAREEKGRGLMEHVRMPPWRA